MERTPSAVTMAMSSSPSRSRSPNAGLPITGCANAARRSDFADAWMRCTSPLPVTAMSSLSASPSTLPTARDCTASRKTTLPTAWDEKWPHSIFPSRCPQISTRASGKCAITGGAENNAGTATESRIAPPGCQCVLALVLEKMNSDGSPVAGVAELLSHGSAISNAAPVTRQAIDDSEQPRISFVPSPSRSMTRGARRVGFNPAMGQLSARLAKRMATRITSPGGLSTSIVMPVS